ncbi:CTD phosphatase Fcp1 [Microbotryomycetes sp. JL201]|nr:CTD phosphatase Fcp1 [Microbotryomycetes sp. JL201]
MESESAFASDFNRVPVPITQYTRPRAVLDQEMPTTPLSVAAVPFPITVQRICAPTSTNIRKTDALFTYSYYTKPTQPNEQREKQFRTWESPIEGIIERWDVKEGQVLHNGRADYTGYSDTSRAAISMVHDVGGLTVSLEEAHRLEAATTERLLKEKKLSLIVDLDQTIVHATVDPTVGEWLEDESNPNFKALQGVQKFQLGPDSAGRVEDGCWYYVKMRPGLRQFLEDVSKIYEMHVYTMGTRAYAIEVCKVIDPDGGLFGGRILSRDESGSLTRKSLQRLFPCDTSMVVIIDDRADVWDGSPNLVKVIPYEFFVGIGDINAAFLPKKEELTANPGSPTSTSGSEASTPKTEDVLSQAATTPPTSAISEADLLVNPAEEIFPSLSGAEASTALTIHDQIENRPLKKAQAEAGQHTHTSPTDGGDGHTPAAESSSSAESPEREVPVLRDDDGELDRLWEILREVRNTFFDQVEQGRTDADVKHIIPERKQRVFQDCRFVFSGLVPLGTRLEDSEYALAANLFGADCQADLDSKTTHLIARENGTAKVHTARRRYPRLPVVRVHWMLDSVQYWKKMPEAPYLLEPEPGQGNKAEAERSTTPPYDADLDESILTAYDRNEEDAPEEGDSVALDLDWGDAAQEIDEFLNETDDEATDTEGARSGKEDESDNERNPDTPRKRMRMNEESDDEFGKKPINGSQVVVDSPLQKRVKVSRARKSGLKVSFPASSPSRGDSERESEKPLPDGNADDAGKSLARPAAASRTNTATTEASSYTNSAPSSSRPASRASSVQESSDDEAFLASMTAELEEGWN